jgi:uncharacterized protein (TIGR02646 family)
MIHIDRRRVPQPLVLAMDRDSPARRELEQAYKDFESGSIRSRQWRFQFKVYQHREVRTALIELFHGKCAYCESKIISVSPVDIEMFRPKSGVVERPEHPGYWWLAMVWENLLPSCAICNRVRNHEGVKTGKANRFPLVDEALRAFEPGQETRENPLLLDPCTDDPEEHLVFEENGLVISDTLRGKTSISVLGLNRPELVEARRNTAQRVGQEFLYILTGADNSLDLLRRMISPDQEYSALRRQLVRQRVEQNDEFAALFTSSLLESLSPSTPIISKSRKRRAKAAFHAFEQEQSSYSLADERGRERYRGQRRLIEQIVIKNIKAIKSLELDFTSKNGRTPWLMLLGENGTGKSTVLQAVALTLLGAQSFVRLTKTQRVRPVDFIRFRCKQGSISVKLSGFPGPHKLVFHDGRVNFTSPTGDKTSVTFRGKDVEVLGSGWDPQTLLLGYGATKLLPKPSGTSKDSTARKGFSRVDNLFDPFMPLIDAEKWLIGLDSIRFDETALILKDLIALGPSAMLTQESGRIMVVDHHAQVPLRQLSDGYLSMVAMTVDILEVAMRLWPNLQEAEGIVLLDELGAHLHPTWKMRVVESLRRALPAMQILATTHDPLCLRGLGDGEVTVMRRGANLEVTALTDLPSPADFRVDQLLTSDFFGLNSTIDPDVEAIFDEYYALMALRDRTEVQTRRLNELTVQLKNRRYFGSTLRESLIYEAVDQLLANRQREPNIPLADLQDAAVSEVRKIWNQSLQSERNPDDDQD